MFQVILISLASPVSGLLLSRDERSEHMVRSSDPAGPAGSRHARSPAPRMGDAPHTIRKDLFRRSQQPDDAVYRSSPLFRIGPPKPPQVTFHTWKTNRFDHQENDPANDSVSRCLRRRLPPDRTPRFGRAGSDSPQLLLQFCCPAIQSRAVSLG